MFQAIQTWFQSKGGFAHVVAAVFASAMLAYAAVPSFHALVLSINAALPGWAEQLLVTAIALYTWYRNNQVKPDPGPTQPISPVPTAGAKLGALLLAMCLPVGLGLLGLSACMLVTGCAGLPAWLTAAGQLTPLFVASAGSILTAIGALTGNPALVAAAAALQLIATDVEKGIKDVQAMVTEYEANPSATLLGSIEEGAQAVIDNLGKLLGDFGLPTTLSAPFISLAQLLLTQFEAWSALIPTLKLAYVDHDVDAIKASVAQLKTVPMTPEAYKEAFNAIVAANPQLAAAAI